MATHKDKRLTRLYRVRRQHPETGEVRETRYYAQRPAARARLARWQSRGWVAVIDYAGPVRFGGSRP